MTLSESGGTYYLTINNMTVIFKSFTNNADAAGSVALRNGEEIVAVLYFEDAKEFFKAWRAMK